MVFGTYFVIAFFSPILFCAVRCNSLENYRLGYDNNQTKYNKHACCVCQRYTNRDESDKNKGNCEQKNGE